MACAILGMSRGYTVRRRKSPLLNKSVLQRTSVNPFMFAQTETLVLRFPNEWHD